MVTSSAPPKEQDWRCIHCREPLTSEAVALKCTGCGRQYPVIAGVPILVSEPLGYVRSELASLHRASSDAQVRRDSLDKIGRDTGLSSVSLARHRDVLNAEIARAATFLELLEPAAKPLEATSHAVGEALGVRRSGWAFDQLFPYLLRDWTESAELQAASSLIRAALQEAVPDSSRKSLAVAGCGAGGLLAEISSEFGHVCGFDLALPVLAAARQLLDGKSLELDLPRVIHSKGHMTLGKSHARARGAKSVLVAMDIFDTAFADRSIDCVVTSFLLDLIGDPRRLADEIHRILAPDGVWINYGPSGPLSALRRFDVEEGTAFFAAAGFTVTRADAHRATYLDLSQACPSWSFQSHMCYLTAARKTARSSEKVGLVAPSDAELSHIVPLHFPGATLVERQSLGAKRTRTMLLRREKIPGRTESHEIGSDAARIMVLVDGKRTVAEIAQLFEPTPPQTVDDTIRAFARFFSQGLLSWRPPGQ